MHTRPTLASAAIVADTCTMNPGRVPEAQDEARGSAGTEEGNGTASGEGARSISTSPTAGSPSDRICRSCRKMGKCPRVDADSTCEYDHPPLMSAAAVGASVPNACVALALPTPRVQTARAGSIPRLHTAIGSQFVFAEQKGSRGVPRGPDTNVILDTVPRHEEVEESDNLGRGRDTRV